MTVPGVLTLEMPDAGVERPEAGVPGSCTCTLVPWTNQKWGRGSRAQPPPTTAHLASRHQQGGGQQLGDLHQLHQPAHRLAQLLQVAHV